LADVAVAHAPLALGDEVANLRFGFQSKFGVVFFV